MKCRGFLAASQLALHVLVVSMAMSPTLHHLLHNDADAPDHQCAATAVLEGHLDRPDAPDLDIAQLPPPIQTETIANPPCPLCHFAQSAHSGRAPPAI